MKGREEIITSLMNMNARYEKLLNEVQLIMEQLVDTLKRQGKEHKEVCFTVINWQANNFLSIFATICFFGTNSVNFCVVLLINK